MTRMCTCKVDIGVHGLIILTYMRSEQQWDKQYQITNQYLDRFSRNLYFVALEVGVSVCYTLTYADKFWTLPLHIHIHIQRRMAAYLEGTRRMPNVPLAYARIVILRWCNTLFWLWWPCIASSAFAYHGHNPLRKKSPWL